MNEPDPGYWETPAKYWVEVSEYPGDQEFSALVKFSVPNLAELFVILEAVVPHYTRERRHEGDDSRFRRIAVRIWESAERRWVRMDGTPLLHSQAGWIEAKTQVLVGSFNF